MDDYPHLQPRKGRTSHELNGSPCASPLASALPTPGMPCRDKDHRQMTWNMDVSENSIPPQLWLFSSHFQGEKDDDQWF